MKKKLFALCFILATAMSTNVFAANLMIDGKPTTLDVAPTIIDGRTLVPVRAISEELGAEVLWNNETKEITVTKDSTVTKLQLDNTTAYINEVATTLDVAATSINGRTLIPTRFLAESLDCDVVWNAETKTISITTKAVDTTTDTPSKTAPTFTDGTYLVGEDISAGLYKVERLPDSIGSYVYRSKDLSMESSSIIASQIFPSSGYTEILNTDKAIKIIGAQLTQIDLKTLTPNLQTELTTGIYLVGYDVAPGVYSVELLEGAQEGYIERSKSVNIKLDTLIATYYIPGSSYLEIADTDFAIKLLNVRIKAK